MRIREEAKSLFGGHRAKPRDPTARESEGNSAAGTAQTEKGGERSPTETTDEPTENGRDAEAAEGEGGEGQRPERKEARWEDWAKPNDTHENNS